MENSKEDWERKRNQLSDASSQLKKLYPLVEWNCHGKEALDLLSDALIHLKEYYTFLMATETLVYSTDLGYFSVLPMEVIACIFGHLDVKSTCRMSRVCTQFRILGNDEANWFRLAHNTLTPQQIEYKPVERTWNFYVLFSLTLKRVFNQNELKNEPGTFIWTQPVDDGKLSDVKYIYSGDWSNSKREGHGIFYWNNGSLYSGEWKNDKREGLGTRIWPNKNKYTGQYMNHKRHGMGEFTFSNGSVFIGVFEDNKFMKGTYRWPNGRIYEGEWNNIFRHGQGSYWWPDGRTYTGDWKNDKRHGKGKYAWPDGDYFEGEFYEGRRWGKGVLHCASGEEYEQEWRESKFEEFKKGTENEEDESVKSVLLRKRKPSEIEEYVLPPPKFPKLDEDSKQSTS